jgi:hypothetical protein
MQAGQQPRVADVARLKIKEAIMRTILLALAFASALSAGAIAQTSDQSISPRDPPFGKGNAENDTFHQPYSGGRTFYGYPDQNVAPAYSPFASRKRGHWQ